MAQNAEAGILKLPNELLGPILYTSASDPRSVGWGSTDINETHPVVLTKVCRRFHELATPLLYGSLHVILPSRRLVRAYEDEYYKYDSSGERSNCTKAEMLHRTLGESPSLWSYCRSLTIEIGYRTPFKNLCLAADIVAWLTAITSFNILNSPRGFDDVLGDASALKLIKEPNSYCWLLRAVSRHSKNLQELYVGGELGHRHFLLPNVVQEVAGLNANTSIRKLSLWGIEKVGKESDWAALRARAGTASFTELIVSQFIASHQALKALVMWPRRLERFEFWLPSTDYYSGDFADPRYTLGSLQDVLWSQRDSLTHLHLRELYTEGIEGFNLTKFTKLRDLVLSRYLTGTDPTLVENLVAPNLEVLHWDQTLEDQQCQESMDFFGQAEEDWLRAFSTAAIERRSALRRIEIKFNPETYVDRGMSQNPIYPWDRMDSVARDIKPHGIELIYNTPAYSREDFWAEVKEKQRPGYWEELFAIQDEHFAEIQAARVQGEREQETGEANEAHQAVRGSEGNDDHDGNEWNDAA